MLQMLQESESLMHQIIAFEILLLGKTASTSITWSIITMLLFILDLTFECLTAWENYRVVNIFWANKTTLIVFSPFIAKLFVEMWGLICYPQARKVPHCPKLKPNFWQR
jgi:hypothetical protein